MEGVKAKVFPFDPPPAKETPLEERLARIAATGEITRSIASPRLPHKKAKEAAQPTLILQGRTITDTKSLFIGSPAAFTDRPTSAPVPNKPKTLENNDEKAVFEPKPAKGPFVKRVFEPIYNWPCAYAKDRELRACPEDKLTTILFGEGRIAAQSKKKEKQRKKNPIKGDKSPLAIKAAPAPSMPSLPPYSSQRSSSLHDLRLREQIKAKVSHKLSRWKREIDSLLQSKKKNVAEEQRRLQQENDRLVKDFEDMKEKFEAQKREVEATLQALRKERAKEEETEKEMAKEFDPELPPARYPKSKAVLRATTDVEKWFTDTVLAKNQLLLSTEKWTSSASPPAPKPAIDLIYLTEVQPVASSRPVLTEPEHAKSALPRLEVAYNSPNDSFEEVHPAVELTSEDEFEDVA